MFFSFKYLFACRNTTCIDEPVSTIALRSKCRVSSEGWQSRVLLYRKLRRFATELQTRVHYQSRMSAAIGMFATKVSRSVCRFVWSERSVLGCESPCGLCVHRRIHWQSIQRLRTSTRRWVRAAVCFILVYPSRKCRRLHAGVAGKCFWSQCD